MTTTTPIVCNPGVWTLVATGSTGITDITIQGPSFGYLVAIGSSPPNGMAVGACPETTTGEFKAKNIALTDNVYVTPTGLNPISVSNITSISVTGGSGGGGGGAVTVADGANITLGAKADAAYTDATGTAPATLIALTKWLGIKLSGILAALGSPFQAGGSIGNTAFGVSGTLPPFAATPTVNIGSVPSIAVTGAFYQATQPVSLSALPSLPAGASLIGAVNLDLGGSAVSVTNPLPTINAYGAPAALSWTSATALNSVGAVTTGGYDTVIVTLVGNAALAGGTVAFELYDGAAWIAVKAGSVSDYTTTASASLTANMNRGYQVPVAGFPQFRVRLAGVIGAGSLTITTITSSAPDTSIVTVGLDPAQPLPAGTNAIGTVLGPLPTAPVTGQQTLTTTAVALPASALQNGLIVTALPVNTGTVYVGAAGVTAASGYPLAAGQSISFAVANASGISIIGTNAADKVAFAGN